MQQRDASHVQKEKQAGVSQSLVSDLFGNFAIPGCNCEVNDVLLDRKD